MSRQWIDIHLLHGPLLTEGGRLSRLSINMDLLTEVNIAAIPVYKHGPSNGGPASSGSLFKKRGPPTEVLATIECG